LAPLAGGWLQSPSALELISAICVSLYQIVKSVTQSRDSYPQPWQKYINNKINKIEFFLLNLEYIHHVGTQVAVSNASGS
jgi:hypothetical protein